MKVRLTNYEIRLIKKLATEIFGSCEVYIFGSRLKEKRGGDIDIYIVPENKEDLFRKKIQLAARLENILSKPVDVVVSRDSNRPIEREAIRGVKI